MFSKIAQQLTNAPGATLGVPSTNAGLAAREVASATEDKMSEANLQVAAMGEGNEDLVQRKQAAWTWYQKHGGKSYNTFVQQFNALHDPRSTLRGRPYD